MSVHSRPAASLSCSASATSALRLMRSRLDSATASADSVLAPRLESENVTRHMKGHDLASAALQGFVGPHASVHDLVKIFGLLSFAINLCIRRIGNDESHEFTHAEERAGVLAPRRAAALLGAEGRQFAASLYSSERRMARRGCGLPAWLGRRAITSRANLPLWPLSCPSLVTTIRDSPEIWPGFTLNRSVAGARKCLGSVRLIAPNKISPGA